MRAQPPCKRRCQSPRISPSQPIQQELRPYWIFCLLEFHQVNRWWEAAQKSGQVNRLFETMKAEEVLSIRLLSMRQISRASEAVGFFGLLNSRPRPAPSPTTPAAPLTAPSAIVKVDPKYAPEVVREKLEGVVILFAVLRKDGTIDGESVRVIRKLDSRLDLSAREALAELEIQAQREERNRGGHPDGGQHPFLLP